MEKEFSSLRVREINETMETIVDKTRKESESVDHMIAEKMRHRSKSMIDCLLNPKEEQLRVLESYLSHVEEEERKSLHEIRKTVNPNRKDGSAFGITIFTFITVFFTLMSATIALASTAR